MVFSPQVAMWLVRTGFVLSALTWGVAASQQDRLPDKKLVLPSLLQEPKQIPVEIPETVRSFAGSKTYIVDPQYQYELSAMIVSRRDQDNLFGYYYKETKDSLNVADLCVVYGDNIISGVYQKSRFSSSDYTCYAKWDKPGDGKGFSNRFLSYNRILSDNSALIEKIKKVRPGDQIYMKGLLVNYYLQGHPESALASSVSRDDEGLGASEVLFVKEFQILSSAHSVWRVVCIVAAWLTGIFLVLWLRVFEVISWGIKEWIRRIENDSELS